MTRSIAQPDQNDLQAGVADRIQASHHEILLALGAFADADATQVADRASALLELLLPHFGDEEAPGGLYDEIRRLTPQAQRELDRLHQEHEELVGMLVGVRGAALAGGDFPAVDAARAAFVERLREHEATETHLITDAWYVDLGDGD